MQKNSFPKASFAVFFIVKGVDKKLFFQKYEKIISLGLIEKIFQTNSIIFNQISEKESNFEPLLSNIYAREHFSKFLCQNKFDFDK